MSNYISVRLSEIERLRRADDAHYMSIPRHEVEWLVTTLREKMADNVRLTAELAERLR